MTDTRFQSLMSIGKYVLIAASLLFILLTIQECRRDKGLLPAQKKEIEKIVTDTVYKGKYFALKKLYDKRSTPSKLIIWDTVYIPSESPVKDITFNPNNGQVTVIPKDTIKPLYNYNERFLSLYPEASKLIEFSLQKNNLSINLLNTDGRVTTQLFPLFLDNIDYQWYDNTLHETPFKEETFSQKLKDNIRFKGLYANGGYDIFNKQALLGLEYNLEIYRFKLDGEIKSSFNNNSPFNAEVKLGYRLFK